MFKTPPSIHGSVVAWQRLLLCGLICMASIGITTCTLGAPSLASTASLDGQTVALCFGTDLDSTSAATASVYTISGATVQSATLLADKRTVLLAVTGLTGTTYTASATGLKDAQGAAGNVSGTGSAL